MLKEMASELNHLSIEKDGLGFSLPDLEALALECRDEESGDQEMKDVPAQQESAVTSIPAPTPAVKKLIVEL
jgi:hypothetical protein